MFGLGIASFAQTDSPTVAPDRPGMATGPDITPFLKVQWETGFESTWDGNPAFLLPTTMLRFGVTRFAELRLEYDGSFYRFNYLGFRDWSYEVQPLVIGTKVKIFEGYKFFQNDVTDWFNIGYNVGAEWSGISHIPSTFLALCLGFNITENFGAFLESYNYFTRHGKRNTEVECNLDFGFNYTVHPRVQLDLYGMFNCQNPRNFNGIGLGVAWLIN